MRIELSNKSWHVNLIKFIYGKSFLSKIENFASYFWLVVFGLLISPLNFLFKLFTFKIGIPE